MLEIYYTCLHGCGIDGVRIGSIQVRETVGKADLCTDGEVVGGSKLQIAHCGLGVSSRDTGAP